MYNPILAKKYNACKHSQKEEIILPQGSKHYSKLICAQCGQWITWGRSPLVTAEHDARVLLIDRYLKYGFCNQWQRDFLRNIRDKRWLTDKQKAKYESITAIYKMN